MDRQGEAGSAKRDRSPGVDHEGSASFKSYLSGLCLAALLTLTSFGVAGTHWVYAPGIPILLAALAIAQMGVHLVFFLHISSAPDHTNNFLALAFGIFVVGLVVFGSMIIMANLNANMMPGSEMTGMQH